MGLVCWVQVVSHTYLLANLDCTLAQRSDFESKGNKLGTYIIWEQLDMDIIITKYAVSCVVQDTSFILRD